MVSTDWSMPGQRVISQCSWSCGQPRYHLSGFTTFLGLELDHYISILELMLKDYFMAPLFIPPIRESNLQDQQYARAGKVTLG